VSIKVIDVSFIRALKYVIGGSFYQRILPSYDGHADDGDDQNKFGSKSLTIDKCSE